MSLIEHLKLGSELESTLSIGKLFQRFMTRSAKKLDLLWIVQKIHNKSKQWSLDFTDNRRSEHLRVVANRYY